MALCRWSSLDYKCDLYVYEGGDGYAVHFASARPDWTPPEPRYIIDRDAGVEGGNWKPRIDAYFTALDAAPLIPIEHKLAGESFFALDAEDAYDICEQVIADGLIAPRSLLEWLYLDIIREYHRVELSPLAA